MPLVGPCGEGRAWLRLGMVGKPSCPAGQLDLSQKDFARMSWYCAGACMWGCGGRRKGQRQGRRHAISNVSCWPPSGPLYIALAFDHVLRSMEVKVPWRVHAWVKRKQGSCCMSCWGISKARPRKIRTSPLNSPSEEEQVVVTQRRRTPSSQHLIERVSYHRPVSTTTQ